MAKFTFIILLSFTFNLYAQRNYSCGVLVDSNELYIMKCRYVKKKDRYDFSKVEYFESISIESGKLYRKCNDIKLKPDSLLSITSYWPFDYSYFEYYNFPKLKSIYFEAEKGEGGSYVTLSEIVKNSPQLEDLSIGYLDSAHVVLKNVQNKNRIKELAFVYLINTERLLSILYEFEGLSKLFISKIDSRYDFLKIVEPNRFENLEDLSIELDWTNLKQLSKLQQFPKLKRLKVINEFNGSLESLQYLKFLENVVLYVPFNESIETKRMIRNILPQAKIYFI